MGKIIKFEELAKVRERHSEKRIVQCHGVFDLLHWGHFLHLESAKKFGDILVVTITPDQFVNKGPGRPKYSALQRAVMLAALAVVDYVAINKFPKALEPIHTLRPDFYVKGPDYRDKQSDITGGILEEEDAVRSEGGQLVFTSDPAESSTTLINQYFSPWDESQLTAIEQVKKEMTLNEILGVIDSFSKLRVLVVGEPIVDTYIFCQPEGLSSKSPTVSARFLNQEDYAGGSLAVANHLEALGCNVSLLITHGGEEYFQKLLKDTVSSGVHLQSHVTLGIPTPRKTRYIVPFRTQRVFELIDLRADQWLHTDPAPFSQTLLRMAQEHDVVIITDFGHGMFENSVLQALKTISTFIGVNVQTNSGNFGFNPFTKHERYDYLSTDERECRLATHDRFTPIRDLAQRAIKTKVGRPASVTLGTAGSLYFDQKKIVYSCPSFFKEVVDTTGAGDAYLALTTLLVKQGAPGIIIPFLGNCFAGLKTRIIGNKSAVSKVDFIRTIQAMLK